jgi:hypothetical protein
MKAVLVEKGLWDYMLPSNAVNPVSMTPDLAKSYQTGADKALTYIQLLL